MAGEDLLAPNPTPANAFPEIPENSCHRYGQSTHVFVSKHLEDSLIAHAERSVFTTGHLPCSVALRSRAREIMETTGTTPADDAELMDRLQRLLLEMMPHARPAVEDDAFESGGFSGQEGKMDFLDRQASDEELMGMDFEVGELEHDGGVRLQ